MKGKTDNQKVREATLDLFAESDRPLSINLVAEELGVSWATARTLLLELAMEGKISAEKTSKSWIFRSFEEGKEMERDDGRIASNDRQNFSSTSKSKRR